MPRIRRRGSASRLRSRMLTYADVCRRMLGRGRGCLAFGGGAPQVAYAHHTQVAQSLSEPHRGSRLRGAALCLQHARYSVGGARSRPSAALDRFPEASRPRHTSCHSRQGLGRMHVLPLLFRRGLGQVPGAAFSVSGGAADRLARTWRGGIRRVLTYAHVCSRMLTSADSEAARWGC